MNNSQTYYKFPNILQKTTPIAYILCNMDGINIILYHFLAWCNEE